MDKTQLQLRIEASVSINSSYPINSYFIDLREYRERPFLNEYELTPSLLTEDDIKTGETHKDIRPAVQARLAHMDFGKVFVDTLNRYKNSNFLLRKYANIKIMGIQIRNNYLMTKAKIKTIRRKGLWNLLGQNLGPHLIYNWLDNIKDLIDNDKAHKI